MIAYIKFQFQCSPSGWIKKIQFQCSPSGWIKKLCLQNSQINFLCEDSDGCLINGGDILLFELWGKKEEKKVIEVSKIFDLET